MKRRLIWACLFCVAILSCDRVPENIVRVEAITDQERVVKAFIKAFNDHDSEAMTRFCHDDIRWGYVDGVSVSIAGNNVQELKQQMTDYFTQYGDVESVAEKISVNNDVVSVLERVSWGKVEERKTQSSLSVYQLRDNRIQSVVYFPTQP